MRVHVEIGADGIHRDIDQSQPLGGAAPLERRLVDRGGETPRRHRGQRADIARPRDVVELAGRPAHARDLDMAAEAGIRPVQRAHQPRHVVLLARQRGAAPLIRAVEEPDAGKAERRGDRPDFLEIGRLRARQPAPAPGDRSAARAAARRPGNQATHSSRNARARASPSRACRSGPPSRTSTTGIAIRLAASSSPFDRAALVARLCQRLGLVERQCRGRSA